MNQTNRPTVKEIDDLLGHAYPILNHGFIRCVDYMGDDNAIVQAARVSYGTGTKTVSEDKGLINYLMRHYHSTPFEMCEIKFHVKLPIFVARQWVRHRMANINEYSARYSILDKEFYIPKPEDMGVQSTTNKQGTEARTLTPEEAGFVQDILVRDASNAYYNYEELLNERDGETIQEGRAKLSRELARMNLSLNYYTQWYWKTDLHNLFNFLRLRCDSHAQKEIRVYADKMLELTELWVPHATEAFKQYRLNAKSFSANELAVLKSKLSPTFWNMENVEGLSKGEFAEFMKKLS